MQEREAQLAVREAALQSKDQQYKSGYISKEELRRNALGILEQEGISYEALTEQVISSAQRNPVYDAHIAKLEAKIADLVEKTEKSETSYTAQQEEAYKAAVNQIRLDTEKLVGADPSFEMIKATGSVKDVVELIEETYKHEGTLLSVQEAAQMVEDHLTEEIEKYARIEKIKKKLAPESTSSKVQQQQGTIQVKQQQPQIKTLTNATSASRPLSARDRAIAAFKGQKI
jgi:hypothetical protein